MLSLFVTRLKPKTAVTRESERASGKQTETISTSLRANRDEPAELNDRGCCLASRSDIETSESERTYRYRLSKHEPCRTTSTPDFGPHRVERLLITKTHCAETENPKSKRWNEFSVYRRHTLSPEDSWSRRTVVNLNQRFTVSSPSRELHYRWSRTLVNNGRPDGKVDGYGEYIRIPTIRSGWRGSTLTSETHEASVQTRFHEMIECAVIDSGVYSISNHFGQETRDPEEGRVKLEEWDVKDEDGRRRIVPTSKESNFWIFVTRWAVKQKRSALDLCHSASPSGAKNATDAPSHRPEGASFAYDTARPPRKLSRGLLRAQEPSSPAPQ
ncbi:hypothetical protein V8E54_015038 [Elaphomyces granulatus]